MKTVLNWLKRKDKILITIFILAAITRFFYLSYTPYDTRTHDVVGGHLDYIKYLIEHRTVPSSTDCWECFQPPTYYVISSAVYWLAESAGVNNPYFYLQLLSLLFFLIFLFFGIKTISTLNIERNTTRIAALLIAFWPSGIIHSVRIGNDALLYLFYAIGFYFLIKWVQEENKKWFYLSLLFSVLSMLTKSNGFMLTFVISTVFIYKWITNRKQNNGFSYIKNSLIFVVVLLIGSSMALYMPMINYKKNDSKSKDFIIGNIHALNGALLVENKPINYLLFDFKTFIKKPFMNPWSDETGRQYYWNYLLKSSLFGEFSDFGKNKNIGTIAQALSLLFTFFIVYSVIMLFLLFKNKKTLPEKNKKIFPIIFISIIIPLLILTITRMKHPFSAQADFRYIFPTIIPLSYLYAVGLENLKNKILLYVGYFLPLFITVLTTTFFIIPYLLK